MPSIRSSFDEKLPNVDILNPPADLYRPVSASSGSTYAQRPPALLVSESANDLALISQKRILAASNLPDKDIPELEDTHLLVTKADVTRITTLQLLNPINLILLKLCPPGIKKIYCNSEISVGKNSRFDILWSFTRGGPEAREMFAVLELKNTYAIDEEEFLSACFERDQAKEALDYIGQPVRGPRTYLSGNAETIIRKYLIGFPFQSISREWKKTLDPFVEKAEELALQTLDGFTHSIAEIDEGDTLVVRLSDASVYSVGMVTPQYSAGFVQQFEVNI